MQTFFLLFLPLLFFTFALPVQTAALTTDFDSLSDVDASNLLIASATSAFSSTLAIPRDIGSSLNELLTVSFAGGTTKVIIEGDPVGGSFALDDLIVTPYSTTRQWDQLGLFRMSSTIFSIIQKVQAESPRKDS